MPLLHQSRQATEPCRAAASAPVGRLLVLIVLHVWRVLCGIKISGEHRSAPAALSRSFNAQCAHAGMERRWVDPEKLGGAVFASDAPAGRFQGQDDVRALLLAQLLYRANLRWFLSSRGVAAYRGRERFRQSAVQVD